MSAEVVIHVDSANSKNSDDREPSKVLTVPIQAVVGGAELGPKRKIYVVEGGKPVEREIVLGMFNEKMVEVREGLAAGDVVVTNPKAILGEKAKTREEAADPNARGAGRSGQGQGKGDKNRPKGVQAPKKNP